MAKNVVTRRVSVAVAVLLSSGAGAALANTVHFEAEAVRQRERGTITSPMLIKDDPAASGGSYLTVAAGNNSPSSAPASTVEGVAKYTFSVSDTGTYRIWARVSAPTNGDDSFWVRMGSSGPWIRFNGFTLGAPYHWVLVAPDPPASPSTFALTAGTDNELQVAYREDGTRLDAFYVTNDSAFNPNAAITGPPAPPIMQPGANGGGAAKVSWSAVPGATSYTVERRGTGCDFNPETGCCEGPPFQVVATGVTGHRFTDTVGGNYRITAVGPTGSSPHPVPGAGNCFPDDPSQGTVFAGTFHYRTQTPLWSVTAPMRFFGHAIGAPAGTNSTSAPPAHGRVRIDFELAAPATMRLWAEIIAPNTAQDSFWARYDDLAWTPWNHLNDGCETLYDSSKSGLPIVRVTLPAGSHRFEFAYREGGARLADNIILLEDFPGQGEQCSD